MSSTSIGSEGKSELKYIALNNAIDGIDSLEKHGRSIIAWIKGTEEDKKAEDASISKGSCLFSLLQEGPDRIQNACDRVHKILEEIQAILS